MHNHMKVGDKCKIGPPSGVFVPSKDDTNVVLISSGIGVTPMLSFLRHLGKDCVKQVLHIDRSKERHAFKAEFEQSGVQCRNIYTSETGRPNLELEAQRLINYATKDAKYYICGPPPFMNQMEKQ